MEKVPCRLKNKLLIDLYLKPTARFIDCYVENGSEIERIYGWTIYDENLNSVNLCEHSPEAVLSMYNNANKAYGE
jgi:hypothetical protein